jgi:maleate isomerase
MNHVANRFVAQIAPSAGVLGRVGLIVLSTDEIGEDAFCAIMPPAVRVFTTRTAYVDESPFGGEFALATSFKAVAETLPPEGRLDVLAFSCTSGTVATGVDTLLARLAEARPGLKYTSPAIAGIAALQSLGARRIALLTPYRPGLHNLFLPFFNRAGFEITADATYDLDTDAKVGEITRESLFDGARMLARQSPMDALFISCTATPVVGLIDELEHDLGVPVVSSSQALAWDALRLVGYSAPIEGFGTLMRQPR